MNKKEYIKLKKELNSFKNELNRLLFEQRSNTSSSELKNDEGLFSGDFNSEASKRTWEQFYKDASYVGLGGSAVLEMTTWHGEDNKILVNHPFTLMGLADVKMPLSDSWKIDYLTTGMKTSDLSNDFKVKSDENGEYYEAKTANQTLKLYLPNTNWFNLFAGKKIPLRFTTEEGLVYSLALSMASKKGLESALQGEEDLGEISASEGKSNPLVVSLMNAAPSEGNGWFWKMDTDAESLIFPYYRREGDKLIGYNAGRVLQKDLYSSFQLWWEKWGIVTQIVASIIVSLFAPGLSLWLVGRFATNPQIYAWLTSNATLFGMTFNVNKSFVLCEFLLESVVNLSAAGIDFFMMEDNFSAAMGLAFCLFPPLIRLGKIGRFIEPYSDEVAESLGKKILAGLKENMRPQDFLKFLEELSPLEKKIFARGLEWLKVNGSKELEKAVKEVMEQAIKRGNFTSKFYQWMVSKGYPMLKTLGAAGLYFVVSAGVYVGVSKLKESWDNRNDDEIKKDASKNAEVMSQKYEEIDEDENMGERSLYQILQDVIEGDPDGNGPKIFYELSKGNEPNDYVIKKVFDEKFKEADEMVKRQKKFNKFFDSQVYPTTVANIKTLNSKKTKPENTRYINDLLSNDELMTAFHFNTLTSDTNFPMKSETLELRSKYPCLDHFQEIEGMVDLDSDGTETYYVKFKCIKPITLPTSEGWVSKMKIGDVIWLYKDGMWWKENSNYKNYYKNFSCPK